MREITSPRWLLIKGGLFLVAGVLAFAVMIIDRRSLRDAAVMATCVWCFARAYYFAFYVIEKYIDPRYKFAGLWSAAKFIAARFVLARRKPRNG